VRLTSWQYDIARTQLQRSAVAVAKNSDFLVDFASIRNARQARHPSIDARPGTGPVVVPPEKQD
jgi:hypothetical protein